MPASCRASFAASLYLQLRLWRCPRSPNASSPGPARPTRSAVCGADPQSGPMLAAQHSTSVRPSRCRTGLLSATISEERTAARPRIDLSARAASYPPRAQPRSLTASLHHGPATELFVYSENVRASQHPITRRRPLPRGNEPQVPSGCRRVLGKTFSSHRARS